MISANNSEEADGSHSTEQTGQQNTRSSPLVHARDPGKYPLLIFYKVEYVICWEKIHMLDKFIR